MNQIFDGIFDDKILHLESHLSASLFKPQISIQWSVANLAWCQEQIIDHNVMMDTLEAVWNFRQSIKKWYFPVDSIVYLKLIASCIIRS